MTREAKDNEIPIMERTLPSGEQVIDLTEDDPVTPERKDKKTRKHADMTVSVRKLLRTGETVTRTEKINHALELHDSQNWIKEMFGDLLETMKNADTMTVTVRMLTDKYRVE